MCFKTDTQIESAIAKNLVGDSFANVQLNPALVFDEGTKGVVQIGDNCGTFEVSDGINVSFDGSIVAQCGACIKFEAEEESNCGSDDSCNPEKIEINDDLKIAVLDDKNCPNGYILYSDLVAKLKEDTEDCDLGEPLEDLPSNANILIDLGECKKGLLKPSALQCDATPEPFCCGNDPCDKE